MPTNYIAVLGYKFFFLPLHKYAKPWRFELHSLEVARREVCNLFLWHSERVSFSEHTP